MAPAKRRKSKTDDGSDNKTETGVPAVNSIQWAEVANSLLVPDFLEDVKRQRSKWIKDSSKFDRGQFCVELTNLYVNYKSTGPLDKNAFSNQQVTITLETTIQEKQAKGRDCTKKTVPAP